MVGNLTYYTLPVDHFGRDPLGEDVNVVNVPQIQATVAALLGSTPPSTPPAPNDPAPSGTPTSPPTDRPTAVDIVNSSGRNGLGRTLAHALGRMGYPTGTITTGDRHTTATMIFYPPGGQGAADQLAGALPGADTGSSAEVTPGTLRIVLGTGFTLPPTPPHPAATTGPLPDTPGTPGTAATAVPITTAGAAPPPNTMSALSGAGVPCVK